MTSAWLDAVTGGSANDGGWPFASATPSEMRSRGSDLSTKSLSERTSRDDASHAPAGATPVQPTAPSGQSETHTAPSFSPVVAGKSVVATSALASGSGTWFGFATRKRRSNETIIAEGGGGGPKACRHRSGPVPSGAETSSGQ